MITILLATVVAYLTRKGVDPVQALEGAPIHMPHIGDGLITFEAPDVLWGDGVYLYLGRDAVCPAAMGWAAVVLGVARGLDRHRPIWLDFRPDWYVMWVCQSSRGAFGWAWQRAIDRGVGPPDERTRLMSGDRPLTPAARLRAVLEYEMGRDQ